MPHRPVPTGALPDAAPANYRYAEMDNPTQTASAVLAAEAALAIGYNGISHAVMMVSPQALEDFVVGFSLGTGIVENMDEIYDICLTQATDAWRAEVQLASRAFWRLKQQRRNLAGSSGCGLCGVAALEQALPQLAALPGGSLPPAEHLQALRERIAQAQQLARQSGALHAAVFIDGRGELLLCREDIGRHNALDKLIGALRRNPPQHPDGFAVVTSRCSLELLHKAVRAGIATLASLSAPTALTVDWARRHNLNLIHVPHSNAPRVYSPAPEEASSRTMTV